MTPKRIIQSQTYQSTWGKQQSQNVNSEHSSQHGENGSKRSVHEEDLQQTPKHNSNHNHNMRKDSSPSWTTKQAKKNYTDCTVEENTYSHPVCENEQTPIPKM